MGKGDKRTKRGKIFKNSYDNTRPHTDKKAKTKTKRKTTPAR
jgi:ribosomal small subunit protein bTHX